MKRACIFCDRNRKEASFAGQNPVRED